MNPATRFAAFFKIALMVFLGAIEGSGRHDFGDDAFFVLGAIGVDLSRLL
jgi:hypothetical protein